MLTNYIIEYSKFIKNFMTNWKEIGSIVPSSRFLAQKMLKEVDFDKARIIVELGTGTGSITKHILKNMHTDCLLVSFETNKEFCDFVKSTLQDQRLMVVNDSALNLKKHLQGARADYIISGIPLAHLDDTNKDFLLKNIKDSLDTTSQYIQFQYSRESHKKLQTLFRFVQVDFTLLGIPPAFIYTCRK